VRMVRRGRMMRRRRMMMMMMMLSEPMAKSGAQPPWKGKNLCKR
jgi:hypothetical protein